METALSLSVFIPAIIIFCVLGIALSALQIFRIYYKRKKRRSPFTEKFLRGPGQSLVDKLDEINMELSENLTLLISMPIVLYALFISDLYFQHRTLSLSSALINIAIGIIFTAYCLFKILRLFTLRRIIRLGYDGEVASGQELGQMMLQGYHVYHDFVTDKFNIDHILVGPAGVFAVETKARSKPVTKNGSAEYKVTYDGKCLHFPKWKEVKPLEQAINQAAWLQQWLTLVTREKTCVRPVVSLPGWFVTRTSKEGIPVINPKRFIDIAKPINGECLNKARIESISHFIKQKCRNIESRAVEGMGG